MAIGDSAGILLRIKADSTDAQKDIKKVASAMSNLTGIFTGNKLSGVTSQITSFAGAIGAIPGVAGLAVGSVAALGAVAATAAFAIFKLTSNVAEYGSLIFDATQKTGLGAVAISSLKVAADQSGASLETVTSAITKFAKTVGAAGDGSEKAAQQLKFLGINPLEALDDLDGALATVFKRIYEARPGIEQITLAQKAFGKSGADLIPVIQATGGNLEAFKRKMEELGVTIDDEAARASDEFGDTLDTLSTQAAGIGRQFATQFMPQITDAMESVSQAMADNKDMAREWGIVIGDVFYAARMSIAGAMDIAKAEVSGFSTAIGLLSNDLLDLKGIINILSLGSFSGLVENIDRYRAGVGARSQQGARTSAEEKAITDSMTAANRAEARKLGGGTGFDETDALEKRAKDRAAEVEKRRREAEQLAQRSLRAGITAATNNLGLDREDISTSLDAMIEKLREIGTSDVAVEGVAREFDRLEKNIALSLAALEKLEDKQRDTNTQAENDLLTQEQRMRRDKEADTLAKAREEFKKGVAKLDEERYEAADKAVAREIEQTKELMRLEEEREQRKLAAPPLERPVMVEGTPDTGFWKSISEDMAAYIEQAVLVRDANGLLEFSFSQAFTTIKDMGVQAFAQLAQGFGQMVANWVLYGNEAEGGLRKMLAGVLANLAAMATTYAIMCLAAAALATTVWGMALLGGTPTQFLLAAALFGAVAAGTALAGRAVAGNSFKRESGRATGGTGGDGAGQGNAPGLNFTERFAGFTQSITGPLTEMIGRQNVVIGGLHDELQHFRTKFSVTSPVALVGAGIEGNEENLFGAVENHMGSDLRASTNLDRLGGKYR